MEHVEKAIKYKETQIVGEIVLMNIDLEIKETSIIPKYLNVGISKLLHKWQIIGKLFIQIIFTYEIKNP